MNWNILFFGWKDLLWTTQTAMKKWEMNRCVNAALDLWSFSFPGNAYLETCGINVAFSDWKYTQTFDFLTSHSYWSRLNIVLSKPENILVLWGYLETTWVESAVSQLEKFITELVRIWRVTIKPKMNPLMNHTSNTCYIDLLCRLVQIPTEPVFLYFLTVKCVNKIDSA